MRRPDKTFPSQRSTIWQKSPYEEKFRLLYSLFLILGKILISDVAPTIDSYPKKCKKLEQNFLQGTAYKATHFLLCVYVALLVVICSSFSWKRDLEV